MAILNSNMKVDLGYDLLVNLGIEAHMIAALQGYKINVNTSYGCIIFFDSTKKIDEVKTTSSALTLLAQGLIGPTSKAALKFTVEAKIVSIISNMAGLPMAILKKDSPAKATTNQPTKDESISPLNVSLPVTVKADIDINEPIDLDKASNVLQVVYGTSEGHTYKVVALLEGIAVAIRCSNTKMSVRVAGSKLAKYNVPLKSAGFNIKADTYASVHYEAKEASLRVKTIGAILATLGLASIKEVADLSSVLENNHA